MTRLTIMSWLLLMMIGVTFAVPPAKTNNALGDRVPPNSKGHQPVIQPLTYVNIVSHFKAADFRATEVQERCTIFFEGEWKSKNDYDYCLIIVENSDEDIQVTFYLTDAHEMNWVTEFLDAPFFARAETSKLFDMLHSGHEFRGKQIGRFRVDFHHWQPKHADILVFSFSKA